MPVNFRATAMVAFLGVLASAPACAHATFEQPETAQNSSYKGVVRIGHGCGGDATHTVIVTIPEGVIGVKPMPKPGWTLATKTGDYARTYDLFGRPQNSGVREITWSGGRLQDSEYDEFVFSSRLSSALPAGKPVYFPVVQLCEKGEQRWTDIPAEGQDVHALKSPAPSVMIRAIQVAQAGGHGTHAGAPPQSAGGVTVMAPWARATPPGARVGGGYVQIENRTAAVDRLISASSEIAGTVEIHEMAMEGGVMKMRALEKGIAIAPGGKAELKPGGLHLMFIDLKRALKEGETFKGELTFEKGGKVTVEFKVMGIGAQGGGHGAHQH